MINVNMDEALAKAAEQMTATVGVGIEQSVRAALKPHADAALEKAVSEIVEAIKVRIFARYSQVRGNAECLVRVVRNDKIG